MSDRTSLFSLYYHNIKIEVARALQFRADFAIGFVTALLFSIISPVTQFLIFRLTRGYPGWSVSEMIVFQGAFVLWTGLRETLFGGVRLNMLTVIRKGDLDRILLKPFHSGGFLLVSGFRFESIGSIIAGIIVLAAAMPATGVVPAIPGILIYLVLILCGILLYMGILLLFCAVTVIGIMTGRISELIDRLLDYSGYPSEIYPGISRMIFEVAVPFAVFVCFPARALLGRLDIVMAGAGVMAVLFFFLSLFIWNYSIKRYTSAGG